MITRENYEEYMMMHADGELKPAEEQELMSFLYEHPELQSELTAFSMSKLIPDDKLVYTRKVTLLKSTEEKKIVPFPMWQRYAIAAGVAALLFISFYRLTTGTTEVPVIAAVETTTPASLPQTAATNAVNEPTKEKMVPAQDLPKPTAAIAAVTRKKESATPRRIKSTPVAKHREPTAVAATTETINKMIPAEMVAYTHLQTFSAPVVTNLPPAPIYIQEGNEATDKSLIVKVPIDELRRKGIENVNTLVASGYDRINAIKQEISETSISLKIEKRKLIVSF